MQVADPTSRRQPSVLYVVLFFVLLSLAWLWPLPTRFATRIAHDRGDPVLNTWILWWNAQATPLTSAWWDAPVFYPMTSAFALSEHLAGIAFFTAPLAWAGVSPVLVYNLALLVACVLSGVCTFVLVRQLTGSTAGGLVAGVAFAFAPYRGSQLAHLQVLNAQWIPLVLLAMHAVVSGGSRGWLAILAAAWVLLGLSNGYFLLFMPVLLALWLMWFGTRGSTRPTTVLAIAGALGAASVVLLPILVHYKVVHDELGITRPLEEMIRFSASPASLMNATPLLAFWPEAKAPTQEAYLFTGVTAPVLALVAVVLYWRRTTLRGLWRDRSPVLFYAAAAIVMYWLAMGPAAADSSATAKLLHPYTLLTWLPGYEGLRAPARFANMGILCLAVLAGFTTAALSRLPRTARLAGFAFVIAGLFVDGWIEPLPAVTPPQRVMLPNLPGASVLELPAHDVNVNLGAMYRSISHGLPVVNGFSGHTPPHFSILTMALVREDPSVLWWLAGGRPLIVIVHRDLEPDGEARGFVERAGGRLHEESGVGPVFVLAPRPRPRDVPDGVLVEARAHQPAPAITVAELPSERILRSLSFAARWRYADVPERITVETSTDGVTWTTAWEDWTGGPMLRGAIENQREVTLKIPLQDRAARFVRVQPSPRWLPRELRIHAAHE